MKNNLIELKDLTLDYGESEVVTGVNLSIYEGQTQVILGPSGVGKSTILKAILGLLKPAFGQVFFQGQDITQLKEKELVAIRLKMGMVFQNGALFDSMTVSENVSFRLREFGLVPQNEVENRVRETLRFVGLEEAAKLKPAQLSGGMRKRVAIARALAPRPEVFLFDEPTVGLDPVNLYNVEQLILKLKQQSKATLIIVTHDVQSACRLGDSLVMLHEGRFIFEGSAEKLKASKDIRIQAFLDPSVLSAAYL